MNKPMILQFIRSPEGSMECREAVYELNRREMLFINKLFDTFLPGRAGVQADWDFLAMVVEPMDLGEGED